MPKPGIDPFFLYDPHTFGYGESAGVDTCFSHQLRVSMEVHGRDSINVPPQSEACFVLFFYFELGLQ